MNKLTSTLARAAALAALCGTSVSHAAPASPADPPTPRPAFLHDRPATVREGYALFVDKGCYLCHGHVAQGSPMSGPPLAIGAPYEYVLRFVRVPRNQMPPYFPETLSDDQVRQIALYLQAIPADKKAAAIPLLNAVVPR